MWRTNGYIFWRVNFYNFRFSYPDIHTVMPETIVSANLPYGITFDSVNRQLFWTELAPGKIKRCNADGSNVTILLNENEPTTLTLDIQNRFVVLIDLTICWSFYIFALPYCKRLHRDTISNMPRYFHNFQTNIRINLVKRKLILMKMYVYKILTYWQSTYSDIDVDVKHLLSTKSENPMRAWKIHSEI